MIAPRMSGRELSTAAWALATAQKREATCGGAYEAASLRETRQALERCADAGARREKRARDALARAQVLYINMYGCDFYGYSDLYGHTTMALPCHG